MACKYPECAATGMGCSDAEPCLTKVRAELAAVRMKRDELQQVLSDIVDRVDANCGRLVNRQDRELIMVTARKALK